MPRTSTRLKPRVLCGARSDVRVGIGVDQHAVDPTSTRRLVLAGVHIAGGPSLRAHSDGDVVLHAVFNAISSALGGSSIGRYHSDQDPRLCGADSAVYLETVSRMLVQQHYAVGNLSIAIECKAPRIEPYTSEMKVRLGELLGCGVDAIGITASTGEGLTAYGRGEGILAHAVVGLVATKSPWGERGRMTVRRRP